MKLPATNRVPAEPKSKPKKITAEEQQKLVDKLSNRFYYMENSGALEMASPSPDQGQRKPEKAVHLPPAKPTPPSQQATDAFRRDRSS